MSTTSFLSAGILDPNSREHLPCLKGYTCIKKVCTYVRTHYDLEDDTAAPHSGIVKLAISALLVLSSVSLSDSGVRRLQTCELLKK